MVRLISAGVKGEVKLRIQLVKERLGRRPVHSFGREHYLCIHLVSPLIYFKRFLLRRFVQQDTLYTW